MEKKIKIVVFGMVVALLVTFLPFRQTDIYAGISENAYGYYQEYGNNVCFFPFSETDGMIYYATKANLASSDIRYRTIGWKLSVKDSSGKKLQTMYFKLGGNYMYAVHRVRKGGAEYNLYALTLGDLKDRLNAKASQALNKGKASMVMDACMIVVRKGKAQGTMNDQGPVSGKVYTTYQGISGAESWSRESYTSFHNYFHKEIQGLFFWVDAIAGEGIASVSGGGEYCYGYTACLKAKAKKGYDFAEWRGDCYGDREKQEFYVTNDVRCVAYGQKKKLQIFFHRNSSKDDTEMDVQTMTYGYGKVPLENIGWKTKGKKLVGWAMKPDAKKADLKCGAVVKDSWIIRYSPKIDLYGVWKTENTDDLTDPDPTDPDPTGPDPTDPDPAGPDPTDPDPETPGTDREDPKPDSKDPDPVKPKDPDEDFPRGKIISFHCRFISKKYFEDAGQNLIPKERGGLAGDSKWITEDSLRVWLRQLLA